MKINKLHAMVLVAIGATSSAAFGATDVYLCADETTQTLPAMASGATATVDVPMWGYALDDDADLTNGCGNPVSVPGPRLSLPAGETSLVVHLRNDLAEATSLVIAGQYMPEDNAGAMLAPVKFTDAKGRARVRSLTAETAAGATQDYYFNNLKPGTFVYKSATHMAKQLQMGLYGAMTNDAAAGQAYAGINYDVDAMVIYSEIDPAINNAVANNQYGSGPGMMSSTIGYKPQYFLINGKPYDVSNPPADIVAGTNDEKTLLRLVNMSSTTHVPIINNARMSIVAEDGNVYHHAKDQYAAVMGAGQTKDALFAPVTAGRFVIYDGEGSVTNGQNSHGGMIAFLDVGAGAGLNAGTPAAPIVFPDTPVITPPVEPPPTGTTNQAPITNKDIVVTAMNTAINIDVLSNDTDDGLPIIPTDVVVQLVAGRTARDITLTTRRGGTVSVSVGSNSILYQPYVGFQGSDVFKYTVTDAAGLESSKGTVRVNVR